MTVEAAKTQWRKDADQLRRAKGAVKMAWSKVEISGELADQCQAAIRVNGEGFSNAAEILDGLAKTVRASATEVEDKIEAERRRRERVEREAEAARLKAQDKAGQ